MTAAKQIPANEITCLICGDVFYAFPSARDVACSPECRSINIGNRFRTHGQTKTRLHSIWCGMKSRCKGTAGPLATEYYFDRGILVCDEWIKSFGSFRDWALANGYRDDLEIDRIDPDGNYEPVNCRWATRVQQMRNTRKHRIKNTTSNYVGVQFMNHKTARPWRALISVDGKPKHIGVFSTEEEAARERDRVAIELHGEFASLNFPKLQGGVPS